MKVVVLLGAPGAGKGSTAELLLQQPHFVHISTGEILREAVLRGDDVGLIAQAFMDRGELVPDQVICELVEQRLALGKPDDRFLLDGFPRTLPQASLLDKSLARRGEEVECAFLLDAPVQLLTERLSGRLTCRACGAIHNTRTLPAGATTCPKCKGELFQRSDDSPDTIRHRFDVYRAETAGLVDYYQDQAKLHRVEAAGSVEETTQAIVALLEKEQPNTP